MESILYITLLFDFYGNLLTPHQQEVFQMYHFSDLSLQEISDKKDISRQAVSDLLRRTEKNLNEHEKKLKLVKRHTEKEAIGLKIFDDIEKIKNHLEDEELSLWLEDLIEEIKLLIEK